MVLSLQTWFIFHETTKMRKCGFHIIFNVNLNGCKGVDEKKNGKKVNWSHAKFHYKINLKLYHFTRAILRVRWIYFNIQVTHKYPKILYFNSKPSYFSRILFIFQPRQCFHKKTRAEQHTFSTWSSLQGLLRNNFSGFAKCYMNMVTCGQMCLS